MIFSIQFLQVCGKQKEAGAGAAFRNFGSGSGDNFKSGYSALDSGSTTLLRRSEHATVINQSDQARRFKNKGIWQPDFFHLIKFMNG
jgi:hypothetical protein